MIKAFSELRCDVLCLSEMGEVQVGLESAFAEAESISSGVAQPAPGSLRRWCVVLDEKEVDVCMNVWKEDFLANELNDQEGLRRREAAARQKVRGAGEELHQFCRTRFQAHLFNISGNIHVLRCMLAQPCTSTEDLLRLARSGFD